MLLLTNDAGRRFRVQAIRRGDRYGLNDCLEHDRDDVLLEFTDVTEGPTAVPQFVARYPAPVILGRDDAADLWLFGHDVAWRLAPEHVRQVRDWVRAGCGPT